jgi:hypothetical protein
MIIGINGKMGSGKDTVGKIIQYLLCNNVEGVTLEDIASSEDHNWWLEEQSGFETKKFAGKLKAMASLLAGVPVEKFEDQEFKKRNMGSEWDYNLIGEDWFGGEPQKRSMTYREFLQKLGTEAMRDGLHTNVWVNALFADYKPSQVRSADSFDLETYDGKYPSWVITDMRFPNELEAVAKRGGITIRVVRDNGTRAINTDFHPSEIALDDYVVNYEIVNDGTIKDLAEKVQIILIKEGIL